MRRIKTVLVDQTGQRAFYRGRIRDKEFAICYEAASLWAGVSKETKSIQIEVKFTEPKRNKNKAWKLVQWNEYAGCPFLVDGQHKFNSLFHLEMLLKNLGIHTFWVRITPVTQ